MALDEIQIRDTDTARDKLLSRYNSGDFLRVEEVIEAVRNLRQHNLPIVINGSLYRSLVDIYASLGRVFHINQRVAVEETARVANELSAIVANLENSEEWVKQNPNRLKKRRSKEFESRTLSKASLERLLDDYDRAIIKRADRQETIKRLSRQFEVDEDLVGSWISRLEEQQSILQKKGLEGSANRIVAEKSLIRQIEMERELNRMGVGEQEIEAIVRELGRSFDNPNDLMEAVRSRVSAMPNKVRSEVVEMVETQRERLVQEVEVTKKIDRQTKISLTEIEEGLRSNQPGIVFSNHKVMIDRLVNRATMTVWEGKYDSIGSAEVWIERGGSLVLVPLKEAIGQTFNADESGQQALDVAIRTTSARNRQLQENNIKLACRFEQDTRVEGIAGEILRLNPEISRSVVNDYANAVTRFTSSLVLPHERRERETSGRYGLDDDAYRVTNLVYRSMMNDHRELTETTNRLEKAGGDSSIQIQAGSSTRASFRFLRELQRNPLLDKGIANIRRQVTRVVLTNTVVIEGATNFVSSTLGYEAIFGIQTATAVPAVMGYFAAGGTVAGAVGGMVKMGVPGWINGLITAGGATVTATGETAAVAGATAVATGAAVAGGEAAAAGAAGLTGGTVAAASGPMGWVIAGVVVAVTAVKKLGKKAVVWLKKYGIDISKFNPFIPAKKLFEELGLGKLGSSIMGASVTVAGFMIILPFLAIWAAFAALSAIFVPIFIGVFILIFVYQMVMVTTPLGSALLPTRETITGETSNRGGYTNVNPIYGESCESTLACVSIEALIQNGFERVVVSNVQAAATILRSLIGRFPFFDIVRFISIMIYNTNRFSAFQCIGYAIAATSGLTTSPSWEALYAGTQPGCVRVAPENAGLGDLIIFPLSSSGHYHVCVLTVVRQDGSAVCSQTNTDGAGALGKWPIPNLANFVSGDNSRNRGAQLTILRCGT